MVQMKCFAGPPEVVGKRSFKIAGGVSVAEVLDKVTVKFPKLKDELYDGEGKLKSHICVLVNGIHINSLDGMETAVENDDRVAVFPVVGGG